MNLIQLLGVKAKETLGGRYKLIQPLGQGGFGHTFLATDLHLPDHPTCVIKQLKPHLQDAESLTTARRLFETEARVLYQLGEHSQIPRLLAHFEDGQEFYLAQELIEGESLSTLIQPGQPWSEARARQLLIEIMTPLAFVHGQGVIHRDLKPSNLIHRRADGHMVLIDFGAVKQVSEKRENGEVTRTISIGTQGYMPNEQLAGNPWFSSDIYAAGMICLQALTGTRPHLLKRDPRTSEVLWQTPDLDISDGFQAILSRMVRYDYRDRYPTATEVLADLQSLPTMASEPIGTGADSGLPIQMATPAKPSHSPGAHSPGVTPALDQGQIETVSISAPTQTFSLEKLQVVTRSLQDATQATVEALPTLLNSRQSRWSILGLSIVTVVALGLVRNGQTSANLTSQSDAAPKVAVTSSDEVAPASDSASAAESPQTAEDAAPADSEPVGATAEPTNPGATAAPNKAPNTATNTPTKAAAPTQASAAQSPAQPSDQASAQPSAAQPSLDELFAKASDLRDRSHYKEALQVYDQVVERSPDEAEAHWGRCYSLNQLQNYGQAVEACELALAIAPENIQALWSKGYALEQQGQPQAALVLYDQTLEIDPSYTEAWNNRGGIMLQQQRFQDALTAYDRALELDPNFAEAWSNRGAALWGLRRFDDAIASIEKALEIQPDYPEAQALRGQIRQKLGR